MDEDSSSGGEVSAMMVSDPYYRKYMALRRRCRVISQDNQRLLNRVYHVQRLVQRTRKECRYIADRLDHYGDGYKEAAVRVSAEENQRLKAEPAATEDDMERIPKTKPKLEKKVKKKKKLNEPKKPSNAFFQFCQEQRSVLLSQAKDEGGTLNKQGLTKLLAANWSQMSPDAKQKYVDRYERDKRLYAAAMQKFHSEARHGAT